MCYFSFWARLYHRDANYGRWGNQKSLFRSGKVNDRSLYELVELTPDWLRCPEKKTLLEISKRKRE
jgi:hypothetical protein